MKFKLHSLGEAGDESSPLLLVGPSVVVMMASLVEPFVKDSDPSFSFDWSLPNDSPLPNDLFEDPSTLISS